jgi:hypothetical protein
MQTGKIVGGIVLLIIGIIIFVVSSGLQPTVNNYQEQCNSLVGEIGKFIDPNTQQKCTQVDVFRSASLGGEILGGALAFVGLIISIVGAVSGNKKVITYARNEQQQPISPQMKTEKIFCRYCGKERLILAEYCSFCGKSSRSLSTNTKKCIGCGLFTSEDSKFCANCGKEFHQSISDNTDITIKNSIDTHNDKIANSPGKNIRELKKHSPLTIISIITGVALAIIIVSAAFYYSTIATTSPKIEASNSSPGNMTNVLTYENSTYGVKMQYPDDWTVGGVNITDTTGNFANFFSPNSQVVQISIDGLGSSGFPLNDYLTRSINGYKSHPQTFPNFILISSDTNTVLAGHPAYTLVGTYYDLDHGTQKVLETGTVIDDKGYFIQYIADEPKYSALLPTVQNMINSFEISKP